MTHFVGKSRDHNYIINATKIDQTKKYVMKKDITDTKVVTKNYNKEKEDFDLADLIL